MRPSDYETLRGVYPTYISAEQLYKICRISKRSAAYLLQQGINPCIDSGKKTRRFKILLEDVIAYLRKREKQGSMLLIGMANLKREKKEKPYFSKLINPPG